MSSMSVDRFEDRWGNRVVSNLKGHFRCLLLLVIMLWSWTMGDVLGQTPNISYTSPQIYSTGTAISTLSPSSSNVPELIYGNVTNHATSGFEGMEGGVVDALGNLYVADYSGKRIRRIAANGTNTLLYQYTDFPPRGMAINSNNGDLYISIETDRILKIVNTNAANYPGQAPVYGSTGTQWGNVWLGINGSGTTDGTGTAARFNSPRGVAVDASNTYLYVADFGNNSIRRVTISTGAVTTFATGITGPEDLVVDANGTVYVTSASTRRVHIASGGTVTDFAGSTSSTAGFLDGQGTTARFNAPRGIKIDGAGTLYVADGTGSDAIRMIPTSGPLAGYVSTLVGSGTGLSGNINGEGRVARFNNPWGVAVDRTRSFLYVTDKGNDAVRKVEIGGYSVWPTLPAGLSMSATTGAITGTPTERSRQVYYQGDFNNIATVVGSRVGSATLASGWVRLTDAVNSQDGAFRVESSTVNTNGLQVEFSLITGKTSGGAQGISYSFSKDAATTGGTNPELGSGTGLSLAFVTSASSTIKMNLYYGSGRANATSPSGSLVASNTVSNALWLGRTSKIFLSISNDGKATVRVDGTTIFSNIELPGYTSEDKSTWYHVFRAVTASAANDIHAIDDLVIRQDPGAVTHTITAYNASGSATATLNINTGSAPTVTSTTATSITVSSASSGGNVTADDDASVTTRGVVWATSANPTVALPTKTSDGSGLGVFTSSITGLSSNTIYYYRAYATNIFGTGYGTEANFTTLAEAPNISYSGSPVTLAVGTPANVTITNTGGVPDAVQVSTLAGSGSSGTNDGTGLSAQFNIPTGVSLDGSGNLYVADFGSNRIRKISMSGTTGTVSTLAGSTDGFLDATGTAAQFRNPSNLVVAGSGNLYVPDFNNNRIRSINLSNGVVTTIAGSSSGSSDGIGTSAGFSGPMGIAIDGSGNLYVTEWSNHRIRKITISGATATVTTVAGSTAGLLDGTGISTRFRNPKGIAVDGSGNILYVADWSNHLIRKITISGATVTVSTLAGSSLGSADGTGTAAQFNNPAAVAIDGSGNLYVTDFNNHLIRKITISGSTATVSTLAGSTQGSTDGAGTAAKFKNPNGITIDESGIIYVAEEGNNRIRTISRYRIEPTLPAGLFFDARNGTISGTPTTAMAAKTYTVFAQNGSGAVTTQITLSVAAAPTATTQAATNLTATTATLNATVNANGDATSALTIKYSTSQTDVNNGIGTTASVSPTSVSGNSNTSVSAAITGLSAGTTYYFRVSATNTAGTTNGSTLSFTTAPAAPAISYPGASSPILLNVGTAMTPLTASGGAAAEPMQVTTLAGSTLGYVDGIGAAAKFRNPTGVVVDGSGNLYVADFSNDRIRKITKSGEVTTLAGAASGVTPSSGYVDGTGSTARFFSPKALAINGGDLYVAEVGNNLIRKIVISTGAVTTLAGSGTKGFADGTGPTANFSYPAGIAIHSSGNIYVSDNQKVIRMVTPSGVVTTPIGNIGAYGYTDGTGNNARFSGVDGLTMDGGIIYAADYWNHRIRKIDISSLAVTTPAGSSNGFAEGTGSAAQFANPIGVAADGNGNIYVADYLNHRIRKVVLSTGLVTTLAGSGTAAFADGNGAEASFNRPQGITVDGNGNIFVADNSNNRIRRISRFSISPALPAGLSFDPATGEISGTPTAITASKTYTVTAANSGGTSTTTFTLEVISSILTTEVSAIGSTTATSGGTVNASYSGITERGIVWNTVTAPETTNNKVVEGNTIPGTFSLNLTGLPVNTTIYARSYVIHSGGTAYGNEVTFTTNRTISMIDVTKNFGDPAFFLTPPTSNGSGAWTFTSGTSSVATTSGNTVTIAGAGTSTITASQAAVAPYASVSTTFLLTVNGQTPTISLGIPTSTPLKDANGLSITPTSNSGGTVTLTLGSGSTTASLTGTPGNYSLSGVASTGDLIFEASVPATGNYAACTLTRTMSVTKNNPTLTFTLSSSTVTYSSGMTQTLTATGGGSSAPVTFSVVSGPGTTSGTNGSTLNISGPGDIVIKASQAGDDTHNPTPDVVRTLTVNPAAPIITSFTPTSATEGQTVTITGENFQNVTAVSFGGTAAASFTVVNSTTITVVMGTGHTGTISVTTASGTDTKSGFRYKVTWTGGTNAFNSTGNWSGGRVPQTDDDIIFSPTAASDLELDENKSVGNVDFNGSGKSLKLGGHNLTIKGNLSMPGNITGSGKLIMGGSSAQTIRGGGDIPELEITNSVGVEIDGAGEELTVSGILRMGSNGRLTTNGKLRLTSNSGGTARVPQLGAGASITGNVIAERYIKRNDNSDGTGRAWRLVSVPVTGSGTLRDFFMNGRMGQDLTQSTSRDAESENSGAPIVGHNHATASEAIAAGFDWIGVPNQVSSLRSYTADVSGGSFASENVPSLSTTYNAAAQGYMVFTRGDRKLDFPSSTNSSATTFRSTGELKTGTQSVDLNPASTSKFTLVGNPYMSVMDLDAFYTTNSTKINPSFWIWDANIAGTQRQGGYVNVYKSGSQWVTNTGTYINPELLESGMAFFVEPVSSLSGTTTIQIEESHKSTETSAGMSPFTTDKEDDHGRMYVRLERADDKGQRQLIDGVMADFHSSHKVALTDMTDREKMRNGISRGALWIPREGKALSGEGLPWPTEVKRSIPLYMSGVGDQTLLVHINPSGMRDRYVAAWLKDNVLKREVEINMSQPFDYDFIGTGRSDWDSTRFEIVYVESGRPGTGVTLEPDDAAEQPTIKLYPNPSKTAEVKLSLRAMAPGAYTVQVLDMTGRLVATSMLQHRSVNGEYRVLEGRHLSPGQYIVRLIDADKQLKETLRMMVE